MSKFLPFLYFFTKGSYKSGSISRNKSTRTSLILITDISFSFLTRVWMNVSGVLTEATSLSSPTYMINDNSTAPVATIGEPEYYLEIKFLFLFPPSTVLSLIVPYLFSLRNT